MKVTFNGHSCFTLSSSAGSVIIDPFLNGNPKASITPAEVKVDAVLVTHGHPDHLGDAVEISKACNAPIIATFELVNYCGEKGAEGHPLHIGGGHDFAFGRVKLTIAHHGSTTGEGTTVGNPCGMLVTIDGKTVYHAGDTGLFSDMALIGEMNSIDLALLPIGDNFTMDIEDAAVAAKMLKAKRAVPMHYNTFDLIEQDPEEFKQALADSMVEVVVLNPGESTEI
ncbi:MAG: metal-dependent hydrolase [Thermodesulfobacteriota bacterium]